MSEKSLGIKCSLSLPKEDQIVGHIPFNLSPILLFHSCLKRDVNKAFARVTGSKINQGAGYGLEIPRVYKFEALYWQAQGVSEVIWTCMTAIMSFSLLLICLCLCRVV